ncbi:MAG: hypothetical protein V7719_16900 [Psychroserpens sp.]|uniref:hypothetical protein n=1 Tax=Psychroserpens sp. TaxID=2020870 RepID=UPI003002371D
MTKDEILGVFHDEFDFISDKFELIDLLENGSKMDYDIIQYLKLPSDENNIVWHPGVYIFFGNANIYRVGVSMHNSRGRVMQHLKAETSKNGYSIWDIDKYDDKSILLLNVKEKKNNHWLLAIEAYLEKELKPLIPSGRIG